MSSETLIFTGLLAKAKEKAETVGHKIQSKVDALNNPNMIMGSGSSGPSQTSTETQPSGPGKKKPDSISVQVSQMQPIKNFVNLALKED